MPSGSSQGKGEVMFELVFVIGMLVLGGLLMAGDQGKY
jgi:hypothetical protein